MVKKKNPLYRRLPRELRSELGKYLVIFLLLTGSIGFVSGFLVADGSILAAYEESFEKYNIEDGNFRLSEKMNRAQQSSIEDFGVTLYDNFYATENLTNGSRLRIFQDRSEVNRVCLMEGRLPETADEIAIDRMYADNHALSVGDTLQSESRSFTISGLVALPDYSCLFEDNGDSMFDALQFGVAVMSAEGFSTFRNAELTWSYSWKYDADIAPADEDAEQEISEELMKVMLSEVTLEAFVPRYLNQAIMFTGDDFSSDKAMMTALLYMVMAIMAFVFAITTGATIAKEANVIGVLRASGYTRGELIRHYMTMPMLVTLAGMLVGNLLGYTIFKDLCAGMYYGSYSLPTYETRWNAEAFLLTTLAPGVLMLLINFVLLRRALGLSPLKFLRRDLSRKGRSRALPLHGRIPFFTRFRLRIIFQNAGSYAILFVGVLFANLLLMFGLIFPSVLNHYQETLTDNLLCNYQYILQIPLSAMNEERKLESLLSMLLFSLDAQTENEDAEAFTAYSLVTLEDEYKSEEILLYGVAADSRYIDADFSEEQIYISQAYAEKFGTQPGDTITLKEEYEDELYEFTVSGVYPYEGALALFMEQDYLNAYFDLGNDYFSGYFSDTEITDLDEQYLSSVIDLDALTKISRQLNISMGTMMYMVDAFSVVMFLVLIYLLSKTIIEKNAQSISMTKILGYTPGEIGRLYILSTTLVVVLCLLATLPLETWIMYWLFRAVMLTSISGWIPFYMDPRIYVQMFALGIAAYALVALLELRKIRRIPMDEALKNVE